MIAEDKTRVILTVKKDLVQKVDEWRSEFGLTRSDFIAYVCEVAFSDCPNVSELAHRLESLNIGMQ